MTKSKKSKSVSVTLEKAEEDMSLKTQVPMEIISSIKSAEQHADDIERIAVQHQLEVAKAQFKQKLWFYGGLLTSVTVLVLAFRFFWSPKPKGAAIVHDLLNGATVLGSRV